MEMVKTKNKQFGALLIFIATVIWGGTYIAQASGANHLGAFTFNALRFWIGAIFLFPIIMVNSSKSGNTFKLWDDSDNISLTIKGGIILGALMVGSIGCQQIGISYTTPGKAGFLATLSVIIVPLLGVFSGKKVAIYQWVAVVIALFGVALISLDAVEGINIGDLLMFASSFFVAFNIITSGRYTRETDSFKLTFMRFIAGAVICTVIALLLEDLNFEMIRKAAPAILYAGIFSSGVAFTLQAESLKYIDGVTASLIMTLEAVFGALFSWLFLGEILSGKELLGCIIVFSTVMGLQIFSRMKKID